MSDERKADSFVQQVKRAAKELEIRGQRKAYGVGLGKCFKIWQ